MQTKIQFTGEFYVPGQTDDLIEEEHLARYRFAAGFAHGCAVFDIACGTGYGGAVLIESAVSYQGVDIRPELVEHARLTYGTNHVAFDLGDICTFDPGRHYDLITCFETIEHVQDYP